MQGLQGVRVVEIGQMVSAPWATKLMADLGADVIKVEPPDGDRARRRGPFPEEPDPERSGLFVYLNTNKRSVVAELGTPAGDAIVGDLLAGADLLVHNLAPRVAVASGLDAATLRATFPHLVTLAVTPFGQTGPYADYRAEELQTVHGGGWGFMSPGSSSRPELPPLKPFGHQADFQAGFVGATAALAAVDCAQRTGRGDHLDLSTMSVVTGMIEAGFITWSYLREIPSRLGAHVLNPWRILPAADGQIFVVCVEQDQWARLKHLMGQPEWADMEIFDDVVGRNNAEDLLHMWLGEWIAPQNVMDLFRAGQAQRVPFAPVFTMEQMANDPHLAARAFLQTFEQPGVGPVTVPGPPSRLTNQWWSIRSPAPRLGQHAGTTFGPPAERPRPASPVAGSEVDGGPMRPLEGVTVADFSWVWAGPYCAMHLAHLGAEVIKIESAQAPDLGRRLPLHSIDHDTTPDTNGYFNQWSQGKKSVTLDLATDEGRALATRLALECDLVLSNYATGVMDRMGLGYEQLRAVRPDVIVAAISGYGHVGPYKDYIGYGPTTAPLSGLSSLTGYEGDVPSEAGVSLGDPAAGIATAFALVAALVARRRTGEGQCIDTTLWEATTVGVAEGWMEYLFSGDQPELRGNHDPLMSPHAVYRCAGDDDWITIACATDAEWASLAEVLDLRHDRFATAAGRKAAEPELDELITAWTTTRDKWEITGQLQAAGVPAFPSLSARELDEDPHLRARGLIEELDHPAVGRRHHIGVPWRSHDGPNGVRSPAPLLGQHTNEVLSDLLGLDDGEIAALREAGVLS